MTFDRRVRSWRAAPCGREPSSSITAWTRAIVWGRTRCGEFSTFETVCRDTAASSATVSSVGRRSTGRLLASPAPSGTVLERSNGVVSANWNAQIDAPRMRRIDPVVKWWRGAAMQQPFLHDLLVAVAAPSQAWSAADGQIRPSGAQGVYHGDVRVLSRVEVCVGDVEPEVLSAAAAGPGTVEVVAALRSVDEAGADPTVRLRLRRRVTPDGMTEEITLEAGTGHPDRAQRSTRRMSWRQPSCGTSRSARGRSPPCAGSSGPRARTHPCWPGRPGPAGRHPSSRATTAGSRPS